MTGGQQRATADHLCEAFGVSERRAAKALGRSRSTVRYQPTTRTDEAAVVAAIRRLVRRHPRWGHRRIHARLMTALGCRPRRRRKSLAKKGFPGTGGNACVARPATAWNDVWTCDFTHDRTVSGGSLKWLSVVDEYTRELLVLRPAADVRRVLGRLVGWRGRPRAVRCDNGGEFVGSAVAEWLASRGVELMAVAPASPWQNAYVESFHGKRRDEFLDLSVFVDVADAAAQAEWYRRDVRHGWHDATDTDDRVIRPDSHLEWTKLRGTGQEGFSPGRAWVFYSAVWMNSLRSRTGPPPTRTPAASWPSARCWTSAPRRTWPTPWASLVGPGGGIPA